MDLGAYTRAGWGNAAQIDDSPLTVLLRPSMNQNRESQLIRAVDGYCDYDAIQSQQGDSDLMSSTDTLLKPGSPSRASSICSGEKNSDFISAQYNMFSS